MTVPQEWGQTRVDQSDMPHHCFRTDHNLARLIIAAREAADLKHGADSIERLPTRDRAHWLACLMEETGEVAHVLTYDGAEDIGDEHQQLADELLDVLAVASAWLDALRVEHGAMPKAAAATWLA